MPLKPWIVLLGLMATAPALAQSKARIVCWNDHDGRRACGNTIPPEFAAQERRYYNPQGVVVETRERQRTRDELQADQAQASAEQAALDEARRLQAYDKFLLDTYRDAGELALQRDRRLADLEGRERLAEQALGETRKSLAELQARQQSLEAQRQAIPARLTSQLQTFTAAEAEHSNALEALRSQKAELTARYDRDIERYRHLREQVTATR